MQITQVLDKVKQTSSSNEKVKILQENDSPELRKFLNKVYDTNKVFGITSEPFVGFQTFGKLTDIPTDLYDTVVNISGRNKKIETIKDGLKPYNSDVVRYFLCGLDRDLGMNAADKVINKAFEGLIPEFGVQLAKPEDKQKFVKYFTGLSYLYLNLKIDGIRCLVNVKDKEDIVFQSRDGKTLQEFLVSNIREEIRSNIEQYQGRQWDGEIYSSKFSKLQRVMNRKMATAESIIIRDSCKLALFDYVDTKTTLENRVPELEKLKEGKYIHTVKYVKVEPDYALIKKVAKAYIEKGHEGIIVKNPFAVYQLKRTFDMMKFKNKETIDLPIVRVVEGERDTKYVGMLGALVLQFNDKEISCGSGFSDKERKELWEIRDTLPGKTCEISFMEKTHKDSLRHPVFELIRTDK